MLIIEIVIEALESQLCQLQQDVPRKLGMNNQYVNFHASALLSRYVPLLKFVCRPTSHVSNVTVDRAILLCAIVDIKKIEVGRLIWNLVLEFVKPSKGL